MKEFDEAHSAVMESVRLGGGDEALEALVDVEFDEAVAKAEGAASSVLEARRVPTIDPDPDTVKGPFVYYISQIWPFLDPPPLPLVSQCKHLLDPPSPRPAYVIYK